MKIGITERGDAGLDTSWKDREAEVDGVILITKNLIRPEFKAALKDWQKPVILHCTLTGMAGIMFEPNVPSIEENLHALSDLLAEGLIKKENVVFRIDPIYPYDLYYAARALDMIYRYAQKEGLIGKCRFRISVMDFYPHVRERLSALGIFHEGTFTPSVFYFVEVSRLFLPYPDLIFETCAENQLTGPNIYAAGCVSEEDIKRMGLGGDGTYFTNPQNRRGCLCLSCKTELLKHRTRCAHGCAYCYWK